MSSDRIVEAGLSSVQAYTREDITNSQHVKFESFVKTLFGLTAERMKAWTDIICKEKWHQDKQLSVALREFCNGSSEMSRYAPMSNIANRVVKMARSRLPGAPDIYPVDDICFKRNYPNHIETTKTRGGLEIPMQPKCLLLRAQHAPNIRPNTYAPAQNKPEIRPLASGSQRGRRGATRTTVTSDHGSRRMVTRASARKAAGTIVPPGPLLSSNAHPTDSDPHSDHPAAEADTTRSRGVRWADVIMNVEFKGNISLSDRLRVFVEDRVRASGAQRKADGGRGGALRRGRGGAARSATGSSSEGRSWTGTKRRRPEDEDEDDLLYHMRRPDPPAWALDDYNNNNPEKESYDVKIAAIQLGSYALETLACTYGTRLFCVNIFIRNDRLYLWYYDACGCLYTESISVVDDFEKTAALFVAIACSSPAQLGALPGSIQPPQRAPYPENWPPESLKDHTLTVPFTISPTGVQTSEDMRITLAEPVFCHYALTGRRSFVCAIKTSSPQQNDDRMIKFSYQVDTRRKEHELVEIAQLAGVGHLPSVHGWGEHWKMSKGVRQIFCDEAGVEYEDRTLRSIVYSKYLPLELLFSHSPQHIPTMAYQLLDCVHDLRYKANILHCDINANNVMYEYRGSRLYFILIDFESAIVLTEDYVPSSQRRTGTPAFMAVDIIQDAALRADHPDHQPIPHMLCHEFESIYWLCLWCTLVFIVVLDRQHRKRLLDIVRTWETEDLQSIANAKFAISVRTLASRGINLPPAAVDARLDAWFSRWTGIWMEREATVSGHNLACEEAEFSSRPMPPGLDNETAGGVLSRDNMMEKLTMVIPDPYASESLGF